MLDISPENLLREVQEACKHREKHTRPARELVRAYATNAYRDDWADPNLKNHENFLYEWVTNTIPNIVDQNPRVCVEAADGEDEMYEALEDGLNGLIEASDLAHTLTEIAVDMQFCFGVGMCTLETTPGGSAGTEAFSDDDAGPLPIDNSSLPSVRPRFHRIDPDLFFMDPLAGSWRRPRFVGHIWIEDRENLKNAKDKIGRPIFNQDAIDQLSSEGVEATFKRISDIETGVNHRPDRNQVVGYEVYVPETGLIYTLSYHNIGGANSAKYLREPRKYVGPATGPYVIFGSQTVPGQVYPLSPLQATRDLWDELNAHAEQASRDAQTAKKLVVVDGRQVGDPIRRAESGSVVTIPGFANSMEQVDLGGVNPSTLEYMGVLRERLDRLVGLTDTVRGNITGATAEEISVAQRNRNLRVRMMQNSFRRSVVQLVTVAAWHMWFLPEVRFEFRKKLGEEGGSVGATFQGGVENEKDALKFDGVQIRIQPYSMEYVDEAVKQRRIQEAGALAVQTMQAAFQNPALNARELLNDIFESMNIRGAGDRYINWQVFEEMRRMAAIQMLAPAMQAAGAMQQMQSAGPTTEVRANAGELTGGNAA